MKYIFFAWLGLLVLLFVAKPVVESAAWSNPHKHYLGINNERKNVFENKKPELPVSAKEEKTYSMFLGKDGMKYFGIVTVKNGKDGKLKLGGGFYREPEFQKLTLMDLKPEDQKTHYGVKIVTQAASGLFGSKKVYQEKEEFPVELEIRASPHGNKPTIILSPKSVDAGYKATFRELKEPVEKKAIGKWIGSDRKGDWTFEINRLSDYQISGTAKSHWGDDEIYCYYPVFGFVTSYDQVILMTGDSTHNTKTCEAMAWYIEPDFENINLKEIKGAGTEQNYITLRKKTE